MNFLVWVEDTALAEYIRVSAFGYPIMITLHAIGLAIMVGISLALALRLLGLFKTLPLAAVHGFLGVAWIGFILNTISGVAIWTTQAVFYMQNIPFLVKIIGVLVGAALVAVLQRRIATDAAGWGDTVPLDIKVIALLSIVVWMVAMVTGRLIAYL